MSKPLPEHHQRLRDERLKRDAEMLALRETGLTLKAIGARYGITKEQAFKIIKRARLAVSATHL